MNNKLKFVLKYEIVSLVYLVLFLGIGACEFRFRRKVVLEVLFWG